MRVGGGGDQHMTCGAQYSGGAGMRNPLELGDGSCRHSMELAPLYICMHGAGPVYICMHAADEKFVFQFLPS